MSEPAAEPALEASAGSAERPTGLRNRLLWVVLGVAATVIAVDQLSKWWVEVHVRPIVEQTGQAAYSFLGGFLKITYTQNTGAAFSFGTGFTWIFAAIAVVVTVVIIRTSRKLGSLAWAVALGGLLGGALGNLVDRLTHPPGIFQGYVTDFIQLPYWAVFNVADMSIVCSAILMVLLSLRGVEYDGRRVGAPAASAAPAAPAAGD